MREIDLHVHTNISDGSESPTETVRYARELGLRAIAITDHDSVNGVAEAQRAGQEYGVEGVAGMDKALGRELILLRMCDNGLASCRADEPGSILDA